jgi:hypothetical protein
MEPWEIEAAFYINHRGFDPDKARTLVVYRWMWHGDFRPLAAAIWASEVLDQAVFDLLAQLIDEGRLKLTPKRKGRPKNPEAQVRNILAALSYEADKGTFAEIAKALGTSEQTVRQAVTAWRRSNK